MAPQRHTTPPLGVWRCHNQATANSLGCQALSGAGRRCSAAPLRAAFLNVGPQLNHDEQSTSWKCHHGVIAASYLHTGRPEATQPTSVRGSGQAGEPLGLMRSERWNSACWVEPPTAVCPVALRVLLPSGGGLGGLQAPLVEQHWPRDNMALNSLASGANLSVSQLILPNSPSVGSTLG